MATNPENLLLEALRSTQAVPPNPGDELVKALKEISNKLDDLKAAVFVSNEIQLELLEGAMKETRSDSGVQARPYRNVPPSSFRRCR